MKLSVYLDNASTTPVSKDVLKAMVPFFSGSFANPSSIHSLGVSAKNAIIDCRKNISKIINSQPDTVIFTSGGTEANNLAIFGLLGHQKPKHIITTETEHSSVLEPIKDLETKGWRVTYLPVDSSGMIKIEDLKKHLSVDTVLVSIMLANNEIGTIADIHEIGKTILRFRKENNTIYPYFHSDICQAPEYLKIDVEKMHLDLFSANGSKIYGPKGVGMLYKRRGVDLLPVVFGGGQEGGLRSGTENVAGIVGFTKAFEKAQSKCNKEFLRLQKLAEFAFKKIVKVLPNAKLNGPQIGEKRLPNNLNLYFPGIDGEKMVIYLDSFGIYCSTASACTAAKNERSHVLKAIGCSENENNSSIRLSLGRYTKKRDLNYLFSALANIKKIAF